jgi:hypothetical protein
MPAILHETYFKQNRELFSEQIFGKERVLCCCFVFVLLLFCFMCFPEEKIHPPPPLPPTCTPFASVLLYNRFNKSNELYIALGEPLLHSESRVPQEVTYTETRIRDKPSLLPSDCLANLWRTGDKSPEKHKAHIYKRLWSSEIGSKKSMLPAYVV